MCDYSRTGPRSQQKVLSESTASTFNVCVGRILYSHSRNKSKERGFIKLMGESHSEDVRARKALLQGYRQCFCTPEMTGDTRRNGDTVHQLFLPGPVPTGTVLVTESVVCQYSCSSASLQTQILSFLCS